MNSLCTLHTHTYIHTYLCEGPDWSAHGLIGYSDESHGHLVCVHGFVGGAILLSQVSIHLLCQLLELCHSCCLVQLLVFIRSKYLRKVSVGITGRK